MDPNNVTATRDLVKTLLLRELMDGNFDNAESVLEYAISVVQSAVEDQSDAEKTLSEILDGLCKDAETAAGTIIKDYLSALKNDSSPKPTVLQEPIQIQKEAAPQLSTVSEPRLNNKQRRKLRKAMRAAQLHSAEEESEEPVVRTVDTLNPSFTAFVYPNLGYSFDFSWFP
jgi:hypothetical protein